MYASVHGTVSAIVGVGTTLLTGSELVGLVAAVASHYVVDKWAEAKIYSDFWGAVYFDTVVLTAIVAMGWYMVFGWWGVAFTYAGLACDVFDKTRSKILGKEEVLPCHRPGYKYWYYLTEQQTKDSILIAVGFSVLMGAGAWLLY
jgi:hypothetical protein